MVEATNSELNIHPDRNFGNLQDSSAEVSLKSISDEDFRLLRDLIYQRSGINLTEQKRSLLIGRLQKLLREKGFRTFGDYYRHLTSSSDERNLGELIDRVSTNHTYFYREQAHFEFFIDTVLPQLIPRLEQENRRDLRIWCAGCSSGEEPYTLLMLMRDYLGQKYSNWNAGILATDISSRALTVARKGVYPEEKLQMLPKKYLDNYFTRLSDGRFQVKEILKKEAVFRRFNLMNPQFPFKKPFQIIFCRNVMIYFDQPTRTALVEKFQTVTEPLGHLFIGHSETLGRNNSGYDYLAPAVYRKRQV